MTEGPTMVYKCPKCKEAVRRISLLSGNTFGAKCFSDGKRTAPMLPEFPAIVKCGKCGGFFWLENGEKDESLLEHGLSEIVPRKWNIFRAMGLGRKKDSGREEISLHNLHKYTGLPFETKDITLEKGDRLPPINIRDGFLSAHEYGEAIDAGMARNRDEEIYLRQNMWWRFNHRTRGGEKLFAGDGDKTLYESNCERLIALLQESERPDRKPLIAELHRNLGRFDKCAEVLETLETIDDKEHAESVERLKKECLAKNSETVRLFSL